jgi:protein TonB
VRRVTPELVTQSVAVALTAAMLWTLHVENESTTLRTAPESPGVQLSLEQAPPMPEPPKPEPVRPKPHEAQVQRPVAQRAVQMPEAPAPVVTDPATAADDSDAPVVMAAEPAASPAGGTSHASIEAQYAAALRQNVDARTSVPNTAEYRLLKPSGAAQIRFVLDRTGDPSDVTVARTSGSRILDRQALDIVASGRYPPFPEAAYPGETRHVFTVTIEFRS